MKVMLIGDGGQEHVGGHLLRAAAQRQECIELVDVRAAWQGNVWRLRDHRPPRMKQFAEQVIATAQRTKPQLVITTGIAPLEATALRRLRAEGATLLNFLTDDPWNPAHRCGWFLEALSEYDIVLTPRRANEDDLRAHGCRSVERMPFAYCPERHFRAELTAEEARTLACDTVFFGGADADRFPWFRTLIQAGYSAGLYGGYWDQDPITRPWARGFAKAHDMRQACAAGDVALCLVRRANRDGHSMRSYEAPAMGACLLVEDTPEHREMFGAEEECVCYFHDEATLLERFARLHQDAALRQRLRQAAHQRIVRGNNTWSDRLTTMQQYALQMARQ
jgi:spore maturation protein CgeB